MKAESITMQLSGVHDSATQKAAAQVLKNIHGVRSASVDRHSAVADVTFFPQKTTVPVLTKALEDAGFLVI
ncbi:MAG: hypothetical protein IJN61_01605 [Clostridia bacterium]|nr:hypothetical protein [Clostridia bacterium]